MLDGYEDRTLIRALGSRSVCKQDWGLLQAESKRENMVRED